MTILRGGDGANGHADWDGRAGMGPLADRLPPVNREAEEGVLGSILIDNGVLPDVTLVLKAAHFYRDENRLVYERILALDAEGKPVDALTLVDALELAGDLDRVGGLDHVTRLYGSVPHAANAVYYAEIVRQKAVTRGVIEACNETLTEAYSYQHTAADLADRLAARAADLNDAGVTDSVRPAAGPVAEFLDRLDHRGQGPSGLPTGFHELDDLTDGWQPGMLYVIAGRPGTGKSVLGLAAADACAARGDPALVFSLEMRNVELCERLMCARSGVASHRLRSPGCLTNAERVDLATAFGAIKAAPLYLDDTPSHNVARVSGLARKYQRRAGIRLVVVDYLQLLDLDDGTRNASRQELVARGSRRLKILARTLDVPVILLSQLNRQSESREGRRPVMADLRESGGIENDADVVLLAHRPDRYDPDDQPGVVELIVDKNRNGATGVVKVGNDLARFRLLDNQDGVDVPRPAGDAPDVRAAAAGPDF